jgi:DNA-binding transcriptional regulator YiaG
MSVASEVPSMAELWAWRKRLGVSRRIVATHLDVSEKTLMRWELDGDDPGEFKRRVVAVLYEDMERDPARYGT